MLLYCLGFFDVRAESCVVVTEARGESQITRKQMSKRAMAVYIYARECQLVTRTRIRWRASHALIMWRDSRTGSLRSRLMARSDADTTGKCTDAIYSLTHICRGRGSESNIGVSLERRGSALSYTVASTCLHSNNVSLFDSLGMLQMASYGFHHTEVFPIQP